MRVETPEQDNGRQGQNNDKDDDKAQTWSATINVSPACELEGNARQDKTRQGKGRQGKKGRQDKPRQDKTRQDKTRKHSEDDFLVNNKHNIESVVGVARHFTVKSEPLFTRE